MKDDIKPAPKAVTTTYENIAVFPETKARFNSVFLTAKADKRRYIRDDFLNELLDRYEAQEGK